jgi:hypothetical protein
VVPHELEHVEEEDEDQLAEEERRGREDHLLEGEKQKEEDRETKGDEVAASEVLILRS